jgi:hypothetical protein
MRTFVPHVESLEDRQLLATALFFNGTNLTFIEGRRNEANAVVLYDFGAGIAVIAENGFRGNFFGITSVTANLGGGNDFFGYFKIAPGVDAPSMTVNVDLGNGNDFGVVNFFNTDLGAAAVTNYAFNINGGSGNDLISFSQNNTANDGNFFPNVGIGSTLSVNAFGGSGNDTILMAFTGENSGTLNALIDGGDGTDNINLLANLSLDTDFSPGLFNIRVRGGAGRDRINAIVNETGGAGTANIDPASTFVIERGDNRDTITTNQAGLVTVQ